MEMYDFVVLDSASLRQLPITAEMLDIFKERIAAEGDGFFQTKEFDCLMEKYNIKEGRVFKDVAQYVEDPGR
jgi:hypothetical protein